MGFLFKTDRNDARRAARRSARAAAFTLVEVVLAITIAVGLLLAVLVFYRQSADLRGQLMAEADRLATIRLLLDRLSVDLRTIPGRCFYTPRLRGTGTLLQVVKADLPTRSAWTGRQMGRVAFAQTDLRLVKYSAAGSATNITGIFRSEEPMVQRQTMRRSAVTVEAPETSGRRPDPLTDDIHFLRFRYFNGSSWVETWSGPELPLGVEVSLGLEPLPEDTLPEDYPYELFRRVIFLPTSSRTKSASSETNAVDAALGPTEGLP